MRRLVGILVLIAGTALLAGCGGGGGGGETLTKDEYQEKVTAAGKELAASFEEIGKEAQAMSKDVSSLDDAKQLFSNLSDVVAKGEENLRTAADELDSISPPDDAQEANDKLVAGLEKMADDFGNLASALDGGSIADIATLGAKLQNITSSEAGKLIQEAIGIKETGFVEYRFRPDSFEVRHLRAAGQMDVNLDELRH